jgi:hypothetical protein
MRGQKVRILRAKERPSPRLGQWALLCALSSTSTLSGNPEKGVKAGDASNVVRDDFSPGFHLPALPLSAISRRCGTLDAAFPTAAPALTGARSDAE